MNKRVTSQRDEAGQVRLVEGTGPITKMLPMGDFLEIYKRDVTFRLRTPDSIDPDRTNENLPWVTSPVAWVGSSHPAIARVLIQSDELLDHATLAAGIQKQEVMLHLHACKESLLACDAIAIRVAGKVSEIIEIIESAGLSIDSSGRGLNPFPQVEDLDADCVTFLVQANRAVKLISQIPSYFLSLKKLHSNFDHLGRALRAEVGESPLCIFVEEQSEFIAKIAELRNFQEHPTAAKETVVRNFHLVPDGSVSVPTWFVDGGDDKPAGAIHLSMKVISKNLVEIA
ncbi:hypothetical protein V2V61_11040, partial [Streptococcus agalactiae]